MPWNRLKIKIYDYNHYCCSPKKKVYEAEPFGVLWSQIHRYTYWKWIFTTEGVPKMDWFKSYTSIILYTHTHNMKYTLNKGMYVFGQDAYKRLHLIKENFFGMAAIIIEKAPKSLHLIKENFFGRATKLIEFIYFNF